MLRAKQKPSANIRHPATKISTLQKTKICSTQNNTQNFRTAVFTGFFEWLAANWVNTLKTANIFAIIRSVIDTTIKNGNNVLNALHLIATFGTE